MVQVVGLLLGDGGLAIEVAHVEGPLNVMFEARPGQGQHIDDPGRPADALGPQARTRFAIDDELLGLGVEPHGGLEGLKLVLGQPVLGPFPDPGGLSDVGIAVKGREALAHGRKLLNRHTCTYSPKLLQDVSLVITSSPGVSEYPRSAPGSRREVSNPTSSSLPITTSTHGSTARAARPASPGVAHELGR